MYVVATWWLDFLKADLQGLSYLEEQHVLLMCKTLLPLFYALCHAKSTKEISKIPDSKCSVSAGHLWEIVHLPPCKGDNSVLEYLTV